MFSGAKNKLQQWRQRKTPSKIMETVAPKEGYQKKAREVTEHLKNLDVECRSVINQLNQQVAALSEIGEDPTVVEEKIDSLEETLKAINKGQQESEAFSSFYDFVESINAAIIKEKSEIGNLQHEAASLFNENRKLRTELQIFQDHHERSELKAEELEVQNEHLKFMNSLPPDHDPYFGGDEKTEAKEEEENFAIEQKVAIPFFEVDYSIESAGSYILSVLDTLDFSANSRLKILFDLIKSYIHEQAYDIAIPLLKTTVEDLSSKYEPHEKIVFTMMEVLVIVYNVTQRFKDCIEVQKEILQIRKTSLPDDKIGLAQTLSNLSLLYVKIGKVKAARVFCRQALDLKNQVYGERDLETAKELHNLAVLYFYDEKYSKAIDCLRTATTLMRNCAKRNVFCIGRAAVNLAFVHIQNEELYEAKCILKSILKFLNKELDKILEGKHISKEDILADEIKIDELSDNEDKKKIIKIVRLVHEVTEKSTAVSHISQADSKETESKYKRVSISDEE